MGYPDSSSTQGSKVLDDFLRRVQDGRENAVEVVRELLPNGKGEKVTLALQNRQLQPELPKAPDRAESPRRSHVFHDMEGFCAYLGQYKTKQTVVFADVDAQQFYAVIDDTAEKGFTVVTMEPQQHPLWSPWDEMLNAPMPVKELAKFMLANRRQIGGKDAKALIRDFSQIRGSAEVELQQGVGKDSINGLMIHTKIQGSKDNAIIDLPDVIVVHAPLFVSLDAQDIEIDVLLQPADPACVSGVLATLTSADATTKTIEAFEQMCQQVKESVQGIVVTTGRPNYKGWDYVGANRVRLFEDDE